MKAANTPTGGGRGSANRGRGRGSMATSGGLQYNQAKERSESGNMDKGNDSRGGEVVPVFPEEGY
ncbi:hypothetical protein HPP92_019852 [Vanilla planifolia]|uniref:Uncharacterized protein n=1 Tax=Vanilla planifolia TaxID=51239 RepID=A0A835Q323_VANPL|nr:hypothetical protein HPP92_019852 [Vanilla planifolia]